jgi:hypothetical protein
MEDHENGLEGGGKRRKGHLTHLARPVVRPQVGVPLSERISFPSGCLAPLQAESGVFSIGLERVNGDPSCTVPTCFVIVWRRRRPGLLLFSSRPLSYCSLFLLNQREKKAENGNRMPK